MTKKPPILHGHDPNKSIGRWTGWSEDGTITGVIDWKTALLLRPMSPARLHAIDIARYGTPRYLSAMSRDTGIPYRTLLRYRNGQTEIKRLAAERIERLVSQSTD